MAYEIEKIYDKETLLEYYLNSIDLGNGTIGVQAVANHYFDKDVSTLSLTECTVLTAIIDRPTYYNPITHPDHGGYSC